MKTGAEQHRRPEGAPRSGSSGRPQSVGSEIGSSPSGTTGDRLTGQLIVRHDWLNVTFPAAIRPDVQQLVERYIGAGTRRDRGANTYAESVGWESGCLLAWSEGRAECWLSMNGDSCDLILPEMKRDFFRELRSIGAKCTRLDGAIDCTRDLLTMELVHRAAADQQVVGFRRYDPRRVVRDMNTGELDQDQANFGRRGRDGSGRYVRIYDKGLETDGKLDFIRVEAEFAGGLAGEVFELLCSTSDDAEFDRLLARLAVGAIDFADRAGAHNHRDRFKRLGWWEKIVELAGDARVRVERVKPTLERSVEWVKAAMPLVLARFARAVERAGADAGEVVGVFVQQLLERGREKLSWREDAYPSDLRCDVPALLGHRVAFDLGIVARDPFQSPAC